MQHFAVTRTLLDIPVAVCDRERAVAYFDAAVSQGRLVKVAFANAHTLTCASHNPQLRATLQDFCVLNDGIGVDLASRIKYGAPFPENLNGTDFMPHYLGQTRRSLRIYLLGGTPDVVRRAARIFARDYPRHAIVGYHHGYLEGADNRQVCAEIVAARADVVLVSMGNPVQELWIAQNAAATGAKLLFGVGALFDFVSGQIPRAPQWIRSLRCEWLYRLAREPGRLWRRYLVGNVVFLRFVLADRRVLGRRNIAAEPGRLSPGKSDAHG